MAQTPIEMQTAYNDFPVFGGKCIIKAFSTVTNGRTLTMTGFAEDYIQQGHVIIKDANGIYKPLPVEDGKFKPAQEGEVYVGLVMATKPSTEPTVGIMNAGLANFQAMPFDPTDILADMKTNLTAIVNNK